MTTSLQLEVVFLDDRTSRKWRVPLTEETFKTMMSNEDPTMHIVFGDGSLFSPLLFGKKFFDPSDAFPLWDFESDVLLSRLRSSTQSSVDWFSNDVEFVLKADTRGIGNGIKVCVEQGKIVEISGQWKTQIAIEPKDWRSGSWWEYGYVRRLELPENADCSKIEAFLKNGTVLEVKIPKETPSA